MAAVTVPVYEALLNAVKDDALQDFVTGLTNANERRAILTEALTVALKAHGLDLADVFDPFDLSLLDAPIDLNTMQLRLNLQIQLQVLKRPTVPLPAMDDTEAKRKAYSGKSTD